MGSTISWIGFFFALGVGSAASLVAIFGYVVDRIAFHFGIGRDDSDSPTERSGVKVITDHGTGIQYLMTPKGGLYPRLGPSSGKSEGTTVLQLARHNPESVS